MSVTMPATLDPLTRRLGRGLRAEALRDAAASAGVLPPFDHRPVSQDDLTPLPEAARRYLRSMGLVGRERDHGFLIRLTGRFRLRGRTWMPFEAWQCNLAAPVTRVFRMRIDAAAGLLPMVGRDAYVGGRGRMTGKLLGSLTVADAAGTEFDRGELVTYLDDALLLAPSMLLTDAATWTAVDGETFEIRLEDQGNAVTAQVTVGPDGDLRDVATDDRWYDGPDGLVRTRWTTPVSGWETCTDGRPWPRVAHAVWHRPEQDVVYVEGVFDCRTPVRNADLVEELGAT